MGGDWLHKGLETYRVPKGLVGETGLSPGDEGLNCLGLQCSRSYPFHGVELTTTALAKAYF